MGGTVPPLFSFGEDRIQIRSGVWRRETGGPAKQAEKGDWPGISAGRPGAIVTKTSLVTAGRAVTEKPEFAAAGFLRDGGHSAP